MWVNINERKEIKGGKYLIIDPNWIESDKRRVAFYANRIGVWTTDDGNQVHPSHYHSLPSEPE